MASSLLLLLGVGPLLLFAPWWPLPTALLAVLFVVIALYLALFVRLISRWWAKQRQPMVESGVVAHRQASWQSGWWDENLARAYVANVGDEAAHQVSIKRGGCVLATATSVPSFSAETIAGSSGLPCYVDLSVRQPERQQAMASSRRLATMGDAEIGTLDLLVEWRSAAGKWCTQRIRTC